MDDVLAGRFCWGSSLAAQPPRAVASDHLTSRLRVETTNDTSGNTAKPTGRAWVRRRWIGLVWWHCSAGCTCGASTDQLLLAWSDNASARDSPTWTLARTPPSVFLTHILPCRRRRRRVLVAAQRTSISLLRYCLPRPTFSFYLLPIFFVAHPGELSHCRGSSRVAPFGISPSRFLYHVLYPSQPTPSHGAIAFSLPTPTTFTITIWIPNPDHNHEPAANIFKGLPSAGTCSFFSSST
jgi:hypothetical protein